MVGVLTLHRTTIGKKVIMAVTGHKSEAMVRKYIRNSDLFADSAAQGLM